MQLRLVNVFRNLVIVLAIFSSNYAIADSIKGTITFIKKPPMVGIAYVPFANSAMSKTEIDQLDKRFTAKMAVVKPGDYVTFKNSDNVEHNVFANTPQQSAKFDVGLMSPGAEKRIKVDWNENSIIRVGCKIHPKMRTYLASIDSPYHKIIEFNKSIKKYTFTINNIPEDAKHFIFNIPKYDAVTIDLTTGILWTVDVSKKGKVRGQITINKSR